MSKPKAPKPPDPVATAAAQTGTNVSTAVANQIGSMVNQRTPDGSLSYNQIGSHSWTDPSTGQTYNIPRFEAVTELDPIAAWTATQNRHAEANLSNLARDQSARLHSLLAEPVNMDGLPQRGQFDRDFSQDRQRVENAILSRVNPQLERDREALRTQLTNQGIGIGTEAYTRAMSDFGQNVNDARMQAILAGGQEQTRLANLDLVGAQFTDAQRGQALNERFAQRNQPINEITALLSGSQVSQPNFVNAPGMSMPTTDYAGIVGQNYAQQMANFNQQNAQRGQMMGGLFSLGAGALSGAGAAGGFGGLFRW